MNPYSGGKTGPSQFSDASATSRLNHRLPATQAKSLEETVNFLETFNCCLRSRRTLKKIRKERFISEARWKTQTINGPIVGYGR